jgi:hypothetical protein
MHPITFPEFRKQKIHFSVGSAIICNNSGHIMAAGPLKLSSTDIMTLMWVKLLLHLLASKMAISLDARNLILEGDSLITLMAFKQAKSGR